MFAGGGFFDTPLRKPLLNGAGHTAQGFDFLNQFPGLAGYPAGQFFQQIGAAPRVNGFGNVGFFLQEYLRVAGNACRKFRRQRNGFVQGVGVQRLRSTEGGGGRFHQGAHHVVERVLCGQTPTAGLAMGAQGHGFGILRVELFDNACPKHTPRPHLGHFAKMVHSYTPKKRKPRCKTVDFQAGLQARADVFQTVGQRVGQFYFGRGAGFLHVVARYADGIKLGHIPGRVFENLGNDIHGRLRRVDVGIAHHKFLQNVVLNGAAELFGTDALFHGRHNVESHHRKHRPVHGHADRHTVERDAVEQDFHVFHRVDGHTGFAHIAFDARVVGVVAAMGGQVKGHRQPFLTRGQVFAIEGIAFFGGGKARILPDGPRAAHIHGGVGPAQIGRNTGGVVFVPEKLLAFGGAFERNFVVFPGHSQRA